MDNLGNSILRGYLFFFLSMNNKFINNNGVNLRHTKNKKTKVESQVEILKQQEQAISEQLKDYEVKQKKVNNLMNALRISERVGGNFLNELVEAEKNSPERDTWRLKYLLKSEVRFEFKFEKQERKVFIS